MTEETTGTEVEQVKIVGAGVVMSGDIDLSAMGLADFSAEAQRDDYPILSFGGDLEAGKPREVNTIYAGDVIIGKLVGTVPMWSLEPKENWKEEEAEGRKYWTSLHYKFKNVKTGEEFGVFNNSTLFNLQKILTSSSSPELADPTVGITYIGKIEGKERLSKEFGIELTKGTSAHVTKLSLPKDVKIDAYQAGCVNYTRNPMPNFGSKVKISRAEQARLNYAAIEARKAKHEGQAQLN